ncbi:general substrate transporter [Halteromyces radiatus]|uniref:general substrate transporter n=1 Tax=Halteromyces radiatus TaxID=101107 RepID=UPI002220BA3A|nr:general substrate transporter [Halteromyces radiatus]KAI8096432.1 general substrate transporter [Halteromyces radiatus]
MSDARYSLVVAMLLAGGLVGALSASHYSDKYGRRQTLVYNNVLLGMGSLIMTLAPSIPLLMVGRFLAGMGGGVVTVVVPAYISECVPKQMRGLFGTLNQLAIVTGIMISQIAGMMLETGWRWILLIGVIIAVLQLVLLPFCVDSPRYLASKQGGTHQAKLSLLRLRGPPLEDVEEEIEEWRRESIVGPDVTTALNNNNNNYVTLTRFLTSSQYRHPLFLVLLLQLAQQFSGINAVIFYSTSIMSSVFPESSDRITVFVSIINLVMTVVSAYLMDRSGRRTLFLISSSAMACSSLLLGWSIQYGHDGTSAFAIVAFVAAFAIGLGPIPFLMIPELVETSAAASAGSVGLASNMCLNFTVSAGFMGLRDIIGQGQVFYVFASILMACTLLGLLYLPETKNKSADQVVRSRWAVPPPFWMKHQYNPIPTSDNPPSL